MPRTPYDAATTMRSLRRGLEVLSVLDRSNGMTLKEVCAVVALPKSTILRILGTLVVTGHVWRRLADGAYLPRHCQRKSSKEDPDDRLAEAAARHLADLSKKIVWPSVLAVPTLDHMLILETNSPLAKVGEVRLGPVGARLSYLHTASGRAYLSACSKDEQEAIISRLRPNNVPKGSDELLRRLLDDAASRGYATRDPKLEWPGFMYAEVRRDGKTSIAVPVWASDRVVASINVHWPTGRETVDGFIKRQFETVRETAALIGLALECPSSRCSPGPAPR